MPSRSRRRSRRRAQPSGIATPATPADEPRTTARPHHARHRPDAPRPELAARPTPTDRSTPPRPQQPDAESAPPQVRQSTPDGTLDAVDRARTDDADQHAAVRRDAPAGAVPTANGAALGRSTGDRPERRRGQRRTVHGGPPNRRTRQRPPRSTAATSARRPAPRRSCAGSSRAGRTCRCTSCDGGSRSTAATTTSPRSPRRAGASTSACRPRGLAPRRAAARRRDRLRAVARSARPDRRRRLSHAPGAPDLATSRTPAGRYDAPVADRSDRVAPSTATPSARAGSSPTWILRRSISCAAALRVRRFRRGETIFHAGDPGDSLFIIAAGLVKITIPPTTGSEPAILTTIGPGGFFGELSLLDGAPRSATAVALDAGRGARPAARRVRPARSTRSPGCGARCWSPSRPRSAA